MGPVLNDVASVEPVSADRIEIKLRTSSSFVLEALETLIRKPGSMTVGTGPFLVADSETNSVLQANTNYFLGPPTIDRIVVSRYPTVRAAWADLLRDRLDMLYEAGLDALDSLESATNVEVFSYVRHYQYLVILNTRKSVLRSADVRRALNSAIDRPALIREGISGHGVASSGPVWPKHWALDADSRTIAYDPARAASVLQRVPGGVRFTCLVVSDDERIALSVKRQLRRVGVNMTVEAVPIGRLQQTVVAGDFDAILFDAISGPSIFRPYLWWHSKAPKNFGRFTSTVVDRALDAIRHAESDELYRIGVMRFHDAILEDPPAIFLAWGERARAVSSRFIVEGEESGVDIVGTLRLWREADKDHTANN
jgi:peptide/nickel transport system substrate-binding protein